MTLEQRVDALERTVDQLTAARAAAAPARRVTEALDEQLVLLEALQTQYPDGAVGYAGHLDTADGPVAWQWGRPTAELLERDWGDSADRLAALGHPVRLRLLQRILTGTRTTAELADDPELGTTGQLHHHLRVLLSAGWLQSAGRGRYVIPAARTVAVLVIVTAAE